MNRDELLDKLAMELAEWPSSKLSCYQVQFNLPNSAKWTKGSGRFVAQSLRMPNFNITKNCWLQRRQELINCPPDSEAPEWAEWKAQEKSGEWCWYRDKPILKTGMWDIPALGSQYQTASYGKIPAGHDWRTTLTRVNRDDNTSTPEEESEFERIQARIDSEKPHKADARILDAQLDRDIATFRQAFSLTDSDQAQGLKYDSEKPRLDLLINDMPMALEEIAAVLTYGANKYAPGNWMHVDDAENRYLAAQMRHELSYAKGNEVDSETHLHELAHSACCALFRLELALRNR